MLEITLVLLMKNKKILTIVGARPQFVKTALVSQELRKYHDEKIIHTGQHYDYELSQEFFDELGIPEPDYNLEVGSGSHGKQTGAMLEKLEMVYEKESPDLVIVYGDTNSTLAGALAAVKLHIPVAHIEAGMRNFDLNKPEEVNRVLTDRISKYLFTPTKNASENLLKEGLINPIITGDVSNDVVLHFKQKAREISNVLNEYDLIEKEYSLLTIHKSSNTDNKSNLECILKGALNSGKKLVFPIHPRTKKCIEDFSLSHYLESEMIQIIPPQGFFDFMVLCENAERIVTDSGGVQKDAYIHEVPCITVRANGTEWVETVNEGWNILVHPNDSASLSKEIREFTPLKAKQNFLGNGFAYRKIVDLINNES